MFEKFLSKPVIDFTGIIETEIGKATQDLAGLQAAIHKAVQEKIAPAIKTQIMPILIEVVKDAVQAELQNYMQAQIPKLP